MMEIRDATTADVADLVRFNVAMASESEDKGLHPPTLQSGIEYLLQNPREGRYLVAQRGAKSVGTLMLTYEWSDWRNGRFWWIQSVYVDQAERRTGVYRALHQHARDLATSDPQSCGIRLYVERDNSGARATYETLNMSETAYRLYEESW